MQSSINRRTFVGTAVASGAFTIVPRHVLGGIGYVAPSGKIRLAHIGMGTQGFNELGGPLVRADAAAPGSRRSQAASHPPAAS